MRKDVKLGLAVGGVLLAVLVVYVLVVPGSNSNQVGATLENVDGSEAQTGGAAAGGDSVAQAETKAPGDTTGGAQDQQTKSGGATADAGNATGSAGAGTATGGASTGTDATAKGATGGANTGANTGATAKDNASASGGWNWDALVNGTEKLPSLGAATDVSTNSTSFANGGGSQPAKATIASNTVPTNGLPTGNGTAIPSGTSVSSGTATNAGVAPQGGGGAEALAHNTDQQPPARTGSTAGQQPSVIDAQPHSIPPQPANVHVVKTGDTYSKISLAVYGTSKHYADIELANPGVDPTRLKPGMKINLPAVSKQPTGTPAVNGAAAAIDPQKEYKVQPNDNLYTISLRLYGKADRMEKIYEWNKAAIGDDMARLKVGMVLKLPEPPTQTTVAAQAQ